MAGNGGVYAIVNILNGKLYIGSSKDIAKRYTEHLRALRRGRHHCVHLQRAWNKYGSVAFSLEVVESVDALSELKAREQRHIDACADRYNMSALANRPTGMDGRKHTPEARTSISKALIGMKRSARSVEYCAKLSIANGGVGQSRTEMTCRVCARLFSASALMVRNGQRKYCSLRCAGIAQGRALVSVACRQCGSEFAKCPSKASKAKYCSRKCWAKSVWSHRKVSPRVSVACRECGTLFETWRCLATRKKYCSKQCHGRAWANARWATELA